jgi:hypothetical protein
MNTTVIPLVTDITGGGERMRDLNDADAELNARASA